MKARVIIVSLAVAFPLIVLAEITASTTDPVATSTENTETVELIGDPEEVAESVEEISTTEESEAVTEETIVVEEASPKQSVTPVVPMFSLLSGSSTDISDIPNLQTTYRQTHGRYLQVLIGNDLPAYESGTVEGKFGTTIPDNVWIDVYDAPAGKGYQIKWIEDGAEHSIGFGPEGDERTYTLIAPEFSSATSTEE